MFGPWFPSGSPGRMCDEARRHRSFALGANMATLAILGPFGLIALGFSFDSRCECQRCSPVDHLELGEAGA